MIPIGNAQNVGARAVHVEPTFPKFLQKVDAFAFKFESGDGVPLDASRMSDFPGDIDPLQFLSAARAGNCTSMYHPYLQVTKLSRKFFSVYMNFKHLYLSKHQVRDAKATLGVKYLGESFLLFCDEVLYRAAIDAPDMETEKKIAVARLTQRGFSKSLLSVFTG